MRNYQATIKATELAFVVLRAESPEEAVEKIKAGEYDDILDTYDFELVQEDITLDKIIDDGECEDEDY